MSSCHAPAPVGADIDSIAIAASVGHDGAMDDLMTRIRPMVLRFCRSRLHGSHIVSAEDVTQEVCLAVMKALPCYENRYRFTAFVFGIASHKVIDVLRAVHRDRSFPVDVLPEVDAGADTPEQHAIRSDGLRHIELLLEVLSPRERTILRLRIIEQHTAAETAGALQMSAGAVRVAQHRALNRLRAELAPSAKTQATQSLIERPR